MLPYQLCLSVLTAKSLAKNRNIMIKLNTVLCIALCCGLSVTLSNEDPKHLTAVFHEASPEKLTDLHPILENAIVDWGGSHSDFDGRLKRIVGGKSKVVAGTNFDLIVELENSRKQTSEWNAQVFQNVDGKLVNVVLTFSGKKFVLKRKRSPRGLTKFGGPYEASNTLLARLYPSLENALLDWGNGHREFGLTLKSIESGEVQVVGDRIYNLRVQVENVDKQASEWKANVVETLHGQILSVKLTAPGKEHILTFAS